MENTKEKTVEHIQQLLAVYSEEQLDLLLKLMEVYSSGCIGKGQIMELAMTREERGKCDTALPQDYVNRIQEMLPCFDTFNYVYDYNEPNTYGTMKNIFEALHIKMQTVLNNSNFI